MSKVYPISTFEEIHKRLFTFPDGSTSLSQIEEYLEENSTDFGNRLDAIKKIAETVGSPSYNLTPNFTASNNNKAANGEGGYRRVITNKHYATSSAADEEGNVVSDQPPKPYYERKLRSFGGEEQPPQPQPQPQQPETTFDRSILGRKLLPNGEAPKPHVFQRRQTQDPFATPQKVDPYQQFRTKSSSSSTSASSQQQFLQSRSMMELSGGVSKGQGNNYRNQNQNQSPQQQQQQTYNNRNHNHNQNQNQRGRHQHQHQPHVVQSFEEWNALRNFKATKFETKTGIQQTLSEIRNTLNKMTDKNYDALKTELMNFLQSLLYNAIIIEEEEQQTDKEEKIITSDEDFETVGNFIFDFASSNQFFGQMYAQLYKEILDLNFAKLDIMRTTIHTRLNSYLALFDQIEFVDSEIDYEGFCRVKKINDGRVALSKFFIHLMNLELISKDRVVSEIIGTLQSKIQTALDEGQVEKRFIVDELVQNYSIFVTSSPDIIWKHDRWASDILPHIEKVVACGVTKTGSLSSRSFYKYVDILEAYKKSRST